MIYEGEERAQDRGEFRVLETVGIVLCHKDPFSHIRHDVPSEVYKTRRLLCTPFSTYIFGELGVNQTDS